MHVLVITKLVQHWLNQKNYKKSGSMFNIDVNRKCSVLRKYCSLYLSARSNQTRKWDPMYLQWWWLWKNSFGLNILVPALCKGHEWLEIHILQVIFVHIPQSETKLKRAPHYYMVFIDDVLYIQASTCISNKNFVHKNAFQ